MLLYVVSNCVLCSFIVIDMGDIDFVDIPRWLNSTAGVVIWSWVCLIAGADVAKFFLN